uniref:PAX-interacting protein 1 n=1 Tax=Callorhinchus milii TaxID=7868 RepID=A0A4W3HEW9_CALMI
MYIDLFYIYIYTHIQCRESQRWFCFGQESIFKTVLVMRIFCFVFNILVSVRVSVHLSIQVTSEDRNTLWALITFYGGDCQLNLNKTCTHLIVPEPQGEKYKCALKRNSIKIVTPDWVEESVREKSLRDECTYHPRLIIPEEEEAEEEDEDEEVEQDDKHSARSSPLSSREGSPVSLRGFSPKRGGAFEKGSSEIMFDDSSDSSPEKQERNLNWTPAEMPPTAAAKRRLAPGKDSALINLCANVPPVPGAAMTPEARAGLLTPGVGQGVGVVGATPGPERQEMVTSWSPAVRTLRNITNSADIQQISRPSNVAQVSERNTWPPFYRRG